jgi:ribosomal protein L37AE/L43A
MSNDKAQSQFNRDKLKIQRTKRSSFDIWVCSGSGLVPAQEAEISSATTVR